MDLQKNWSDLGLSATALDLLIKAKFSAPTPVQAESIPLALEGNDLIVSAQTGTGKTASFVLPLSERFAGREGTFVLILAPTREIAQQTLGTIELFAKPRGLRTAVLIGGVDMRHDRAALDTFPQIIVATPGRLCDHLDRGNIWLDYIQMVILDEADRMLDMGFSDQLSRIMQEVPKERQTMIYSATYPPTVDRLAQRILHDPKKVAIGKTSSAATTVEQKLVWMSEASKPRELRRLLREEPGKIIVFARSKEGVNRVWRSLHSNGVYDATFIHSDRLQAHREQALAEFKEGKYRILIATDVAGRGIHVDGIAHVINYDLPMEAEDYIHRIGRTGRVDITGKPTSGKATTFATPRDRGIMREVERLVGKEIPSITLEGANDRPPPRGGDRGGRGGDRGRGGQGGRSEGRSGERDGARAESRAPREGNSGPRSAPSNGAAESNGAHAQAGASQDQGGPGAGPEGGAPSGRRRRRRGGRGRRGAGGGGGGDRPSGTPNT